VLNNVPVPGAPRHRQLFEREAQIGQLEALLTHAAVGRGAVTLIVGTAGLGKTTLLARGRQLAAQRGLSVLRARGTELESELAFGVARQLFEQHLVEPAAAESLMQGAARASAAVFPHLSAGRHADDDLNVVMHGLYWLLVGLAEQEPLLLVIDDAHWADPPSLRWIAYVANRLESLPVAILVAARPFEPGGPDQVLGALAAQAGVTQLALRPLSSGGVEALIAEQFGQTAAPEFASTCFELTQGNPFLVRAVLDAFASDGRSPDALGAQQLRAHTPPTVARVVEQRLRVLPAHAQRLLAALAVLEQAPRPHTAQQLAELDEQAAASAADVLIRSELVRADGSALVHPIVRGAVFDRLSPFERCELHGRAARLLAREAADADLVAAHVLASQPAADPWAVAVLRQAAERATSRGAPDLAAQYLRRAIAEPPAIAERPRVLFSLGLAELAGGGLTGFARLQEALETESEPTELERMAVRAAQMHFTQGRFREAANALAPALDAGSEQAEAQLLGMALLDYDLLRELGGLEAVARRAGAHGDDPRFLAVVAWIAAMRQPPAKAVLELAERALASGRFSVEHQPQALTSAVAAVMVSGGLTTARTIWDEAVHAARERGAVAHLNFALVMHAGVLHRLGEVAHAEADLREILERALPAAPDPMEWRASIPWLLSPFIEALLERDKRDEAAQWLALSGLEGDYPELLQFTYLLDSVGQLRLAQGRIAEAVALLSECGARQRAWGIENPALVPWRSHLAQALARAGEREQALELAEEEVHRARAFGATRELGLALRVRGTALGDRAGADSLAEAVALLERSEARLDYAKALVQQGIALHHTGASAQARDPLRLGMDVATRCGALAVASVARAELVAAGGRPRRAVLRGVAALTASELRVATLAAEGLGNRRIAETLFVTEKTVEGHLAHAYRKLDISARSELARALSNSDETAARTDDGRRGEASAELRQRWSARARR
jgi:DNA-binding NarL/FixJ family response regulator